MTPYGTPISSGIDSNREYEIKRLMAEDAINQRRVAREQFVVKRMEDMSNDLQHSFESVIQSPDDENVQAAHNAHVDAFGQELDLLRPGQKVSPVYLGILKNKPDVAARLFKELEAAGVNPATHFQMANNPDMLRAGISALQRSLSGAQRAKAGMEKTGEATPSSTDTTAPPTSQAPGGTGLRVVGGGGQTVQSPAPFTSAPAVIESTPLPETPTAQPAPATPQPASAVKIESLKADLRRAIAAKVSQMNEQRRLLTPEKDLAAHQNELAVMRQDLRNLEQKGPLEEQTRLLQPVPEGELRTGVRTAQNAGRQDIADLIKPGMLRGAFEGVMSNVGTTQSSAPNAEAPTAPTPSPIPAQPGRSTSLGKGYSLLQTEAEKREEDLRLQGEKDIRVHAADKLLGQSAADLKSLTDKAMADRQKLKLYSIMTESAKNVGPTGKYLTPLREQVYSLAGLVGVRNPHTLAYMDLISKLTNQLSFEMVHQLGNRVTNNELMTALKSNPGLFQTNEGMAILLKVGEIMSAEGVWAHQQAMAWLGDPAHGDSLYGRDKDGRTFHQTLDDSLDAYYAKRGNVGQQVAAYFGSDPQDILRGKITPLNKKR